MLFIRMLVFARCMCFFTKPLKVLCKFPVIINGVIIVIKKGQPEISALTQMAFLFVKATSFSVGNR